jgi:glutamyl-tRNA reductase
MNNISCLENFFVAGINYKNTSESIRGQFAINNEQYSNILKLAPYYDINELFVISTCNRTEIYGLAKNALQLIELLCSQTTGKIELFKSLAYLKTGIQAMNHLYNVASGLDSQILGDYEIVSQIKQAVQFAKDHKFIHSFSDRLVNSVLQSSKKIKSETSLSSGSVSVSFTAVKYLKEETNFTSNNKILVIGTGKLGRNTCKNLVKYFGTTNITLINRSEEKAIKLALELNLNYASINELEFHVHESDIILLATNSAEPIFLKSFLENTGNKLIIDLSIPCNVEAGANKLSNITLINIDQLSQLKDENLKKRAAEVPKAKKIISEHLTEFIEWHEKRKQVPVLKAIKTKLNEIQKVLLFSSSSAGKRSAAPDVEGKIQQVINRTANKLMKTKQYGCHYIEAINEFMRLSVIE